MWSQIPFPSIYIEGGGSRMWSQIPFPSIYIEGGGSRMWSQIPFPSIYIDDVVTNSLPFHFYMLGRCGRKFHSLKRLTTKIMISIYTEGGGSRMWSQIPFPSIYIEGGGSRCSQIPFPSIYIEDANSLPFQNQGYDLHLHRGW